MNKHLASLVSAFAISCASQSATPPSTKSTVERARQNITVQETQESIGKLRPGDYCKANGKKGNWFDDEKNRQEHHLNEFFEIVDGRRKKAANELRADETPSERRENLREAFSKLSMQDKIDYLAGRKKLDERIELWVHEGVGDETDTYESPDNNSVDYRKSFEELSGHDNFLLWKRGKEPDFTEPIPLDWYAEWTKLQTNETDFESKQNYKAARHIQKIVKAAKRKSPIEFAKNFGGTYTRTSTKIPEYEKLLQFKEHPERISTVQALFSKYEIHTFGFEYYHNGIRCHLHAQINGRPHNFTLVLGEHGITSAKVFRPDDEFGAWDLPNYVTRQHALNAVENAYRLAREEKRDEFNRQFELLIERQPTTEDKTNPVHLRKEHLDRIYLLMRNEPKPLIEHAAADKGLGAIVHFSSKKGVDLVVRGEKIVGAYEW